MLTQGMYHQQKLSLSFNHEQKQSLHYLLKLEMHLCGPEIPEAVRGLEGMMIADRMLKEKNSRGLLIGGCAKAIWNQRRTPEEVAERKDVDVVVLDESYDLEKPFAGGIDWWMPKKEKIETRTIYGGSFNAEQKWWENGNGAVLNCYFNFHEESKLPAGLYIPDAEFVANYEMAVRLALVDEETFQKIDDDVLEKFRKHLEKGIGKNLPAWIRKAFAGQILSSKYSERYHDTWPIKVREMEKEVLLALKK